MERADKIATIKELVGNDAKATDALVSVYLDRAESVILRRLYPFGIPDGAEFPEMYDMMSCELTSRYFFRMGSEGEQIHNENGIHRHYGSVNDEDILREIMPYVQVLG